MRRQPINNLRTMFGGTTEPQPATQQQPYQKNELEDIIKYMWCHQIQMKMFHFQTTKYGAHKASDAYLIAFGPLFDRFMEVAQGIDRFGGDNRKITTTTSEAWNIGDVKLVTDTNGMIAELVEHVDYLTKKMSTNCEDKCNGLKNIRDEMIALAQQTAYLLKFE